MGRPGHQDSDRRGRSLLSAAVATAVAALHADATGQVRDTDPASILDQGQSPS